MAINLKRLDKLCKGNEEKRQRYLHQLLEMVPPRLELIEAGMKSGEHEKIRQSIHFLAPQLTFFGLPEFAGILENLETDPSLENWNKQYQPIENAVDKINVALTEIKTLLA